jgi:hypothetical protein
MTRFGLCVLAGVCLLASIIVPRGGMAAELGAFHGGAGNTVFQIMPDGTIKGGTVLDALGAPKLGPTTGPCGKGLKQDTHLCPPTIADVQSGPEPKIAKFPPPCGPSSLCGPGVGLGGSFDRKTGRSLGDYLGSVGRSNF